MKTANAWLEDLEREEHEGRKEMDGALGRLTAGLISGTVVLGIFTALRPNLFEEMSTGLVLLILVPFFGLMITSLWIPLRFGAISPTSCTRVAIPKFCRNSTTGRRGDTRSLVSDPNLKSSSDTQYERPTTPLPTPG